MSQQPPDTSQSQSYVDLARGDGTVELSVPVIRVHFALSNTAGRLQARAHLLDITELFVLAGPQWVVMTRHAHVGCVRLLR